MITWPLLFASMPGRACCVQRNVPRRFVAMTLSNCPEVVDSNEVKYVTPALFTRTSTRPSVSQIFACAFATLDSERTSQTTEYATPPSCTICSTTRFSCRACLPETATAVPIRANARATAAPIPRDPPETHTTGAFTSFMCYPSLLEMSVRNSDRVLMLLRNVPSIALVVANEFCFSTPRIIMHIWRASHTTPTPSGSSTS